ncbi:hypothetical protein AAIH25_10170 [Arthrobacter crystallopoietes]|uniref:hypothetical protein n=1 Tax=Micrococcaceae TaxID=1268 RepID=UPI0021C58189|nr:hypothetical protein [Arthrobacter sp. Marseille-P9274]
MTPAKHRAAALALAFAAATGCSAPVSGSAGPAASPAPSPAAEGPCRLLAEGRVAFEAGGADHVTFAIGEAYGKTEVKLTACVRVPGGYAEEWEAVGFTGSEGFGKPGPVRVNSLLTPSGSYTVTEAFGRENPGTALEYHELSPSSRWGARPGDHYQQYFEGTGAWPDENLWELMEDGLYEQAAVINYNRPPDMEPRPGLSHAIFLHAGMEESWGCISTDLATVTAFLRTAVPGDRIIMGVEDAVFAAPGPARG